MKKCVTCGEKKPLKHFGKNQKKPDGKQPYCRECGRKKDKAYYQRSPKRRSEIRRYAAKQLEERRNIILTHLSANPCVDCGETDPVVLEFDHVRGVKKSEIANLQKGCSITTLVDEIKKCDVRCANCHRRKTAKENGYYDRCLRLVAKTTLS